MEVTDLNGICVAPLEKAYVPPVGGGEEKNGEGEEHFSYLSKS